MDRLRLIFSSIIESRRVLAKLLGTVWSRVPDRPIFIIGTPRSGKSTLESLLARHPDVVTWSEIPDVWDPHNMDPESCHAWEASRATLQEKRRLQGQFYWYTKLAGKKRFVNCHARTTVRIPYVLRIFPDCKLIHVQRDGRAVVNAMVNKICKEPNRQRIPMGGYCRPPRFREMLRDDLVEQTCLQWLGIVETFERDTQNLPSSRICSVRSEDLCHTPQRVMSEVFSYCELSVLWDVVSDMPKKLTASSSEWRSDRSPSEIATMQRILVPKLKAMGYV